MPSIQLSPLAISCGCGTVAPAVLAAACDCAQPEVIYAFEEPQANGDDNSSGGAESISQDGAQKPHVSLVMFLNELYRSGKQLLVMFLGFAFIGYFLNGLLPTSWVAAMFGGGNIYNVPLAATLGLPLYINSEASLPLIRALLDNGMSQGAALAFLIAGAGTSVGAITGALTIARWRVVGLVVGILWVGAILSGLAFNLALMFKLV
jgi:uncharacterized membrane protein YraQ (UPF0718 family)